MTKLLMTLIRDKNTKIRTIIIKSRLFSKIPNLVPKIRKIKTEYR